MIEKEFTIREPKISLWKILVSAFFISVFLTFCFLVYSKNSDNPLSLIYLLLFAIFILKQNILHTISRKQIHLNFRHLKIKHELIIGPFVYRKKWKDLENLEYIAVFNNTQVYEVNLWHDKNKNMNLFADEDIDEVMTKAFFFADKLDIDLLDARERGYHRWVNKDKFRETNTIEYLN